MLNRPEKLPFSRVSYLGIAIRRFTEAPQLHVGLLFSAAENEPPELLHLRTHLDLRNELPSNDYFWAQVELDDLNLRNLAQYCKLIASKKNKVPYGFTYNGQHFDVSGEYRHQGLGYGLTCATFVMAVFETWKIRLLKTEEWQQHPEDLAWQAQMVAHLMERFGALVAQNVNAHIGNTRFRPEQAAAGAMRRSRPLGFDEARALGMRIVRELNAG